MSLKIHLANCITVESIRTRLAKLGPRSSDRPVWPFLVKYFSHHLLLLLLIESTTSRSRLPRTFYSAFKSQNISYGHAKPVPIRRINNFVSKNFRVCPRPRFLWAPIKRITYCSNRLLSSSLEFYNVSGIINYSFDISLISDDRFCVYENRLIAFALSLESRPLGGSIDLDSISRYTSISSRGDACRLRWLVIVATASITAVKSDYRLYVQTNRNNTDEMSIDHSLNDQFEFAVL